MLVDTSFLIDLFDGDEKADRKRQELREEGERLFIPAGVAFELYTTAGDDEQDTIETVLENMPRAGLTEESEKQAAELRTRQLEKGEPIKSVDYLIAGIARQLDQKVLTADNHFHSIEGVEVEEYR